MSTPAISLTETITCNNVYHMFAQEDGLCAVDCSVVVTQDGDGVPVCQLARVFVISYLQGNGIARHLLEKAEAIGRENGCKAIRLHAQDDGRIVWRHMRPQARLLDVNGIGAEWRRWSKGEPLPATVGELPEEFAKRCLGYLMEWEL